MAKLLILFTILLIFKNSYGASFGVKLNDLEEVVEELNEEIKDLLKIFETVKSLSTVTAEYEKTIIYSAINNDIFEILKDLQDSILEVEAQSPEDSKKCIDLALRKSMIVTLELENDVKICVTDANVITAELKAIIENLNYKAINIKDEATKGFHTCEVENEIDNKIKCLRKLVDNLKEYLQVLNDEIKQSQDVVEYKVNNGLKELNLCLNVDKEDLSLKKDHIVEELEECVKKNFNFLQIYNQKSIIDIIKELKEKIASIIYIITHLPTSIEEIPEKINELISHINIKLVVQQLKKEVDDIFNEAGVGSTKCRPFADEQIESLQTSAEKDAGQCGTEAHDKVKKIKAQFLALGEEAKQILADIKTEAEKCLNENGIDLPGYYKCLEKNVKIFQERAAKLQENATEAYENAKNQAEDIIQALASCVNKIQIATINKSQAIIDDVQNCVDNTRHQFYM